MLAIEVELLTGRYVATAYNSRRQVEWPPHPARLFSALASTHFSSDQPDVTERALLEWLESQEAPSIWASEASARDVVTVFVPVNDAGMTNVDGEGETVDELRIALAAAQASGEAKSTKKAATALVAAEKRLRAAVDRDTGIPKDSANPQAGLRVLPEHRVRQPRTFPSVTPHDPRVRYVWPKAEPTMAQREAMDRLLARLVRLGHSSSLASARLLHNEPESTWRPAKTGEIVLRTMQAGQLSGLERAYVLHRETEPRLMPARFQAYTRAPLEMESSMAHTVFSDDWLVLRRVGGPAVPMVAAAGVARVLRRALMARLSADIPHVLSGHTPEGLPSDRDHMAVVPLPFVGHLHASGAILGVALVLPRAASDAERQAIYTAVDMWEQAERIEDEDAPGLHLNLGAAGVLELERVEWGVVPSTLRETTWCRPARQWLSVTPVALDRNPGDLKSRDPRKLAAAIGEAETTIRAACVRIGLPQPTHVEILPAAAVAGAAKARLYPAHPAEPGKTRRVLTHVALEFAAPICGPLLLGAGRYLGLGLFRPVDSHA